MAANCFFLDSHKDPVLSASLSGEQPLTADIIVLQTEYIGHKSITKSLTGH